MNRNALRQLRTALPIGFMWAARAGAGARTEPTERAKRSKTFISMRWSPTAVRGCARNLARRGARPHDARSRPRLRGDWAEEEFGAVKLRDGRHRKRLFTVARDFYAQPAANIPQACESRAKTKGAYRFFEHKAVSMNALLSSHYHSTMERIARDKIQVVLAVQDSTSFNYDTHADMEGLGPINTRVDGAQGILLHDTMAYTTEGTAMGLVDIQVWARDPSQFGKRATRYQRPIEQKESFKWLKSFRAAARLQRQLGAASTVVSMGDREADVYELFALAKSDPAHPKLLVRAESDRRVKDTRVCLWEYMESQPVAGQRVLHIPRKKGRAARDGVLKIRFAQVTLRPPKLKSSLPALTCLGGVCHRGQSAFGKRCRGVDAVDHS